MNYRMIVEMDYPVPDRELTEGEKNLLKRRMYYLEHRDKLKAKSLAAYYKKKEKLVAAGEEPKKRGRPPKGFPETLQV